MNDHPIPPEKKDSFDLDEVELHGDIRVGRAGPVDESAKPVKSYLGLMWVFVILTLIISGALAFFVVAYGNLKSDLDLLAEKKGEAQANLTATEGSLQKIQEQLDRDRAQAEKLRLNIARLEAELKDLQTQNDVLERKNAAADKALAQAKKRATDAERKAKREAEKATKTSADFRTYRQTQEAKIAELNAALESHDQTTTALQDELNTQQTKIQQLSGEQERLERQLREEGAASLALIQERSRLQQTNEDLIAERNRLRDALNDAESKIAAMERVESGELVPFSSRINPAVLTYRAPFPKDLKIPRRQGPLVVQMLINEVGAVENAFVVPGQSLEREAARALIDHVKSWKFSPPMLDGVRVKTWQPILVQTR